MPVFNKCVSNFSNASNTKKYNFRKANFPDLYNSLSEIDWSFLFTYTDVNTACNAFYEKLVFDHHIPIYKAKKHRYPTWYT